MASMEKHSKPHIFVEKIDLNLAEKLLADLKNQGFTISKPQYTLFSAKKPGISCTLYTSGKLMVQGKGTADFMEFYLEPEILKSFDYTYSALNLDTTLRIGIDESGKGDAFGPLCVAGVCAGGEDIVKLQKIGVCDSKKMADSKILKLGKKIEAEFPHHIVKIFPAKYNELYDQFKNLNRLLAWGHATTIEQLVTKTKCHKVIIDQFASENVVITALKRKDLTLDLTQRHRGEEDVVVAAASILARKAFVEGLEKLERAFNCLLPKGASAATVAAIHKFIDAHGPKALTQVGKLHFKTFQQIIGSQ